MKTEIPENLKADLPASKWGKILSGTPVILAVVATMLAGLASSEMTKAQYARALAAQLQSKAGDQWSFFQAKRLRSALQHSTIDLMSSATGHSTPEGGGWLEALKGTPAGAALETPEGRAAVAILRGESFPKLPAAAPADPAVHNALTLLETSRPEPEVVEQLAKVDDQALEEAIRVARDQTTALDTILKPIGQIIDTAEKQVGRPEVETAIRRDFIAARLGYNARRYDLEARLNQAVASLYELQVRKANLAATRHHNRSQKFFYGMLAAQLGVIVSTLAIAARKRNLLWTLAAIAGVAAIAFAAYVYLYV